MTKKEELNIINHQLIGWFHGYLSKNPDEGLAYTMHQFAELNGITEIRFGSFLKYIPDAKSNI